MIGAIVCRNAGTKRKSRSEAVEEPETKVAEASDDEADADQDDMVLSRIPPADAQTEVRSRIRIILETEGAGDAAPKKKARRHS